MESAESPLDEGEALAAEAARIEALIAEVMASADPRVRELIRELVRSVLDFHGGALARVAAVLLLHDLHPLGPEERVRAAIERVRPMLRSRGGDAELVRLEDPCTD